MNADEIRNDMSPHSFRFQKSSLSDLIKKKQKARFSFAKSVCFLRVPKNERASDSQFS